MKHLNRFNENGRYAAAHNLMNKLKDGFAIEVNNVERFFDILKDITWIEVPLYSTEYRLDKYYFILIGSRLLHTDKPKIGDQYLDVYKFDI